jgi:alpha-methylacyl-CoA racemase
MAGVLLDNMGADVIRVDRIEPHEMDRMVDRKYMVNRRNKRSVCTDVRREGGVGALRRLVSSADGVIDPYRPGVGERFGIGPEVSRSSIRVWSMDE